MMIRLLAFALNVPADDRAGALEIAKGMWEPEEAELWQKDLTGRIVHWIEVGQPEERRLRQGERPRRSGQRLRLQPRRAGLVGSDRGRIERAGNVVAWLVPSEQSKALA